MGSVVRPGVWRVNLNLSLNDLRRQFLGAGALKNNTQDKILAFVQNDSYVPAVSVAVPIIVVVLVSTGVAVLVVLLLR